MAVLTRDDFAEKWGLKFADNEIQNIDEPMLREFKDDIKDSALWNDDDGQPTTPGQGTGKPILAVVTALAATSFDVVVAPGMPVVTARYRLRAIPKPTGTGGTGGDTGTGGGGTTTPPTQPPAPSGFTVDSDRQAVFTPDAGTTLSDYEYQIEE